VLSAPTDFRSILGPEDVDVNGLLEPGDTDVLAETLIVPDSDDQASSKPSPNFDHQMRLDAEGPQLTLNIATSWMPYSAILMDAPCTPSLPTGHLDNTGPLLTRWKGCLGVIHSCFGTGVAVKDCAHECIQSLRGVSMTDSEELWPQLVRCAPHLSTVPLISDKVQ
jgi:hypothetical protein